MEFTLKYAKSNIDQSISVYGQPGSIPKKQLLSYMAQNGGIDILGIFDGTKVNQKAPTRYLVKTSMLASNRVEGFDIDFPLVINFISELFEDKRATKPADPEAVHHLTNTFTQQKLLSQLRFFASQNSFSELHTKKLEMVLSALLADIKTDTVHSTQWNNIAKSFDSKPILIHWIDQQFANIKATIPFAPTLSKQDLSSLLKQFSIQRRLSKSQIGTLEATLKSILSEVKNDAINRTEWEKISKKHSYQPVIYEFNTLGEVESFLEEHHHAVIEELPELISEVDSKGFPTEAADLIKLSDQNSFFIINDETNKTKRYIQLEVEEKQQTSLEYFLSWVTWQLPEKFLKNNEATKHQSLFNLLEAGQQTWEVEAKQQQQRNTLIYAGIAALIATPGLIYTFNSLSQNYSQIINENELQTAELDRKQLFTKLETPALTSALNETSDLEVTPINGFQVGQGTYHRPWQLFHPIPEAYCVVGSQQLVDGYLYVSSNKPIFSEAIILAPTCPYVSKTNDSFIYLASYNYNTWNQIVDCMKGFSYTFPPHIVSSSSTIFNYTLTFSVTTHPNYENVYCSGAQQFHVITQGINEAGAIQARPNINFNLYPAIEFQTMILPVEEVIVRSDLANIASQLNLSNPACANVTLTTNGFIIPGNNPSSTITDCLHRVEATVAQPSDGSVTVSVLNQGILTSAEISKKVAVKGFDLSGLKQLNSYFRTKLNSNLFSYSDTQETNEVFLGEFLNVTSPQSVTFSKAGSDDVWTSTKNGVTSNGGKLTSAAIETGFNSLKASINAPSTIFVQLTSAVGENVANTSFSYNIGETEFHLPKYLTLSHTGITAIADDKVIPITGNVALLPGEELVFTGSAISSLKAENCPIAPGASESAVIIKGPRSLEEMNNCFNHMTINNPPEDFFSLLSVLKLKGNIVHTASGKTIEGFSIDLRHPAYGYLVALITIGSASLSVYALKGRYKAGKQFALSLYTTHSYGQTLRERVAFLSQTPRDIYQDRQVAFQTATTDLSNKVRTQGQALPTDNSIPYKLAIAIHLSLKEQFSTTKQQRRNRLEKIAEWILSKFREQKPWTEDLVKIINKDLADAGDHVDLHSALTEIIRTKLQNVTTDDNLYKIIQQANTLFEAGKSVPFKTAKNACYRLQNTNANYIAPPAGTLLAPMGITIIPPSIVVRTVGCFANCFVYLWENRPHCPTPPHPSCPSRETVRRAAICLVTANHCCNFFGSAAQYRETLNEDSETAELLPKGSSSND